MQLDNIKIEGFRGITDLTISDLGMVNLLVGKNNCSKTSVLEALFMLTGGGNPELVYRVNAFRNLFFIEADDLRLLFNNLDYEKKLIIQGNYKEAGMSRELQIKPGKRTVQTLTSKNKKNGLSDQDINTATGEPIVNELLLDLKIKSYQSPLQSYVSSAILNENEFSFKVAKNYKETQKGLFLSSSSFALSGNLEKRLENFIVNKREKDIIEVLRSVEPNLIGISLGTNKMIYVDIGIERLIPLNLMGDGLRRVLSIVLGIADMNNGIILIDEIDNGLHFSAMASLWKAVLKASQEFKVQIFATTHNYETIKYLKEVLESPEMLAHQNCIRSITLRKLQDGNLKSYNYNYEKLGFAIEQGIEFR